MDVGDVVEGLDYDHLPVGAVLRHDTDPGYLIRVPGGIYASFTGQVTTLHAWFDPRTVIYLPPVN